jgi:hypothetical protein
VMCGCTGRRRRVGPRISGARRGRRTVGRDRRRIGHRPDRMCVRHHRALNLDGLMRVPDPSRVGRTMAGDPDLVGPMVAHDRSLVGQITARGRNPVGPTGARALNLVDRMVARDLSLRGLTMARDPSRADLTEVRRIGRRRRRQGSGRGAPMRGSPLPTNPTNVRRHNRSDPPGLAPERVCDGSQIARLAIPHLPGWRPRLTVVTNQ